MKKSFLSLFILGIQFSVSGQISGNINYQNRIGMMPSTNVASIPNENQMIVNVKGMANLKPDFYVAVFGVTQIAKTKEEAVSTINERINTSLSEIKKKNVKEVFTDLVSFVPKFDFVQQERKIFSKKTYTEVPIGFEIKKNIHIQFSNARDLDDFMLILAQNEIYDLIKVDVFAKDLDSVKNNVMSKAKTLIKEKMKDYELILEDNFKEKEKSLTEAFSYFYPLEMYKSFVAYNNNSTVQLSQNSNIIALSKDRDLYYQPVQNKNFDFVLNPVIVEPSVQVVYEMNVLLKKKEDSQQKKEYIFITNNGDLKKFPL